MRAALREARKGLGRTHPNPAVGAVIVRRGRILARGYHHGAGQPHAEIEALRRLKGSARGCTIYITLEPCSTHGRTPPCTRAIITSGFARVVYGARDPNPLHQGRADRILRRAGITVKSGMLEEICTSLNKAWNKWILTGLPYVIAKAALTLDGRIGSHPGSRWLSNEESRTDAMKLRASVDAILVGGATARADNPRLTIRDIKAPQPWRVVWTRSGALPPDARILTDAFRDKTLVCHDRTLAALLRRLGSRGICSVLIEGGGFVLGQAFDHHLVDEVRFYLAPLVTGGPTPAVGGEGVDANESRLRLGRPVFRRIGSDVCLSAPVLPR